MKVIVQAKAYQLQQKGKSVVAFFLWHLPSTTEGELCDNQPHALQLPLMDAAALHGVDAGGVHAGVAQNIRQPGQVFFQRVVGPCE